MMVKIKEMMEKIVFNEAQLLQLKRALSEFGTNKLSIKNVKSMILDQRTQIMEDTIDLLHFFMDQQPNELEETPSESLLELQAKLKEREYLLEEIGRKLEQLINSGLNISEQQ